MSIKGYIKWRIKLINRAWKEIPIAGKLIFSGIFSFFISLFFGIYDSAYSLNKMWLSIAYGLLYYGFGAIATGFIYIWIRMDYDSYLQYHKED
jgi:hypothetical protein